MLFTGMAACACMCVPPSLPRSSLSPARACTCLPYCLPLFSHHKCGSEWCFPHSPPTSFPSLILQVDKGGESLTVSLFSLGGITWTSVSVPVPSTLPPPPTASGSPPSAPSFRRMLLQALSRAGGPPTQQTAIGPHILSPLPVRGGPPYKGWPPTSGLNLPSQLIKLPGSRSLQALGTTCAPAITYCETVVLPQIGEREVQ